MSQLDRDHYPGNILDQIAELQRQVEELARSLPGPAGEAADRVAYYRPDDASLHAPGDIYSPTAVSGWLPFIAYNDPSGNSSDVNLFFCTISRDMTVRSWLQSVIVGTTNDGSNYWTVTLEKNETTTITSFTTAGDTPNTWTLHKLEDMDEEMESGTDLTLNIKVAKTGSPSNISLAGPAVFAT